MKSDVDVPELELYTGEQTMLHLLSSLIAIRDRFLRWGRTMSERSEREDLADKIIHQRFIEMLEDMVEAEEIDSEDAARAMRKISWYLPLPLDNATFIDLIAQLQQKEGEEQERKTVKVLIR